MSSVIEKEMVNDFVGFCKKNKQKARSIKNGFVLNGFSYKANADKEIKLNAKQRWIGFCYYQDISIEDYRKGLRATKKDRFYE